MRGFAIFLAYLIVEIAIAFWLASIVGWLLVIGLTIAGFALGVIVMSSAGTQAAAALREASATGSTPSGSVGNSATRFFAGVLIATPGFVTDVLGLLLLIPPVGSLARRLGVLGFAKWARRQNLSVVTTTVQGESVTRVVPGDVVVGDVIKREDGGEPSGPAPSSSDPERRPEINPGSEPPS